MKNVVLADRQERNLEDFDVEKDILFFKIGAIGLVSFHGRNYNIKKRISAQEIERLVTDGTFYPASPECFVNIRKISAVENGAVYFGKDASESKYVPVSRRKQHALRGLLEQRRA